MSMRERARMEMPKFRNEDQNAMVLNLHKQSQTRNICFCLGGSTKLDQAFGPWMGNSKGALEVTEKGRSNNYHICGGSYLLDFQAPNRNPPKVSQQPKCPKKLPFNLGYRTTKYNRRGQERCVEKDFAAFQHLDSCMDYAQHYRMSKSHPACTGSVMNTSSEEPQKSGMHTKNFWTIKYDEKYMEGCCKPTLAESFKINPYTAPGSFSHLHQHSHNYRGTAATSTPEHNSFYAKTGQNPAFLPSSEDPMELDTDEILWMPKNAVFQHRNSSASMYHSRGYFIKYNRPSYSQQTSREFLALGRRATPRARSSAQIIISHSRRPDSTLQTTQHINKEEPRQHHQIGLNQHYQFRPCAGHGRLYSGTVMGPDWKSQENETTRLPFLSKATLFSSENSTTTKDSISTPGTSDSNQVRFPKLPNKLVDRNKMQVNSGQFLNISSKRDAHTQSEEKQECSNSTTTSKSGDGSADGKLEFNGGLRLEMPKKWEEEYLDQTPKKSSVSFPYPQRLFSMESVNKRLLEHGIVMREVDTAKKERTEKSLEEGKHRMAVDDGEVKGAFGMLQVEKLAVHHSCLTRIEKWRHKEKKKAKVIMGKSGHGTTCSVPQQRACKNKLDQKGTFTDDELHPVELCYGE